MLWGEGTQQRLAESHVILFGLGGVGSYTAECLARAGIGELTIVDNDTVSPTNLNRQLEALHSTLGQYKVDVAEQRIKEINPNAVVRTYKTFYAPQTAEQFDFTQYDYIVDAIDTVTGKLELIEQAQKAGSCLRNDPANSAHMPMGIPIYFTIVTSLCSTSR